MTSQFLETLNEQQKIAAIHDTGPALVLAGAGSGKTRVLTTRVAYLITEKSVDPDTILLVTFTNKAAGEMKQRVEQLTGSNLRFSGTFHSLCAKILRRHGYLIGLSPSFTIYDSDEQLSLLKQIYKEHGFSTKDVHPKAAKGEISTAKNNLISPEEYQKSAVGHFQEQTARIYKLYQHNLRKNEALDFDDLLLFTVRLLEESEQARSLYQQQFKYVMVDEYQDTNRVQYVLTKLFAAPQNNLFVVGDFAQSIYAWRGADYKNMKLLQKDFPKIQEYRLEQNYRSTQSILDAATHVISQTDEHPVLNLWTEQPLSEKLVCIETASSDQEAQTVIQRIKKLSARYSLNDIAILYRTNAQSRSFEEACISYGVPYRLIGGFKFYERKEIKDVLAYLKYLVNPNDTISQQRALKLGKRIFAKFETWKEKQIGEEIVDVAQEVATQEESSQSTSPFNHLSPWKLIIDILDVTQYRKKYDASDPEQAARLENIDELLSVANQFTSTTSFLENIALIQDNYLSDAPEEESNQQAITLMSLHSAKGLEFPVVFMVGMEEGLLPHSRSITSKSQLEEERRLCYVGITRAKEKVYFSYAQRRWQYGSTTYSVRSRFLNDIPQDLMILSGEKLSPVTQGNSYGYNSNNNYYSKKKASKPKATSSERRVVVDDDILDGLLSGDIDIEKFLND